MSKKAIGCDLGSTLSEVCIIENGEPTVIVTSEGSRTFPSVVCIDKNGERKVGAPAKRQMLMNPKNTINLVKRLMGRRYDDVEVAKTKKHVQYEIVNHNGWAYVKLDGKEYSPQEISSWILGGLKKMAEDYCGEEITDAVITVPAMFPDSARTATKEAGELAGLNVLRIINEPTSATLASRLDKSGVYLVSDIGGSTSDFSILDYDKDTTTIEILASDGDTFLGGADFDNDVANWVVDEFKKDRGIDLKNDQMAMQRVYEAVEKAKIELSNSPQTEINLPYITAVNGTPEHLTMTLSKAKFEQLIASDVDRLIDCAKKSLSKAKEKSSFNKLDGIILVGGSCRIPIVQERLEKELDTTLIKKADLDLAVAQGASIQANILAGNVSDTDILLLDVLPVSLGLRVQNNEFCKMIEANTSIPTKREETFSTAVDNQTMVSIDIAQGERLMFSDNKLVGHFMLDGIAPAMRGIPQISVVFDVDANGILTVSATDKATGKSQNVTVKDSTSLSKEDIEKIKADAEAHKEEDEKKKKELEKINSAETMVYSIETALKSLGDKITEDEKKNLDEKVNALKETLKDRKVEEVEKAQKELEEVWNPIIQKMYASAASQNGQNPNPTDGNPMGGFNPEDILKGGFGGMGGVDPTENPSTTPPTTDEDTTDFEEVE